jgi:hypothetical protein
MAKPGALTREVDPMPIAQKVREALSLEALRKRLPMPKELGAVSVEVEEYVDHDGEDALKVWIVLRDDVDEDKLPYDDVLKLKWGIRQRLRELGETRFPYTHLTKQSEPRRNEGE